MGVVFSPSGEFFSTVGADEQVRNDYGYLMFNNPLVFSGFSVEN